jgi:hypoxanthine phosphoribosyltransferase
VEGGRESRGCHAAGGLHILWVMDAAPTIRFAHDSEAEFARILDFYGIRWEYEPRSFPLEWSREGRVIESFSPDFYLPDLDLYIELTTLKQSLVTRKNRKVRRLRELYPNVRVKIFYGRDYRNLVAKYDLEASETP